MIHVNSLQDRVEGPAGLDELLRGLAREVLRRADRAGAELGITLADDAHVRALNREYRGVDAPTDVLSFGLDEDGGAEPGHAAAGPDLLGDIVISMERAAAQADEFGHSLRREVAYLTVHGLLHLLGYDHADLNAQRRMRAAEEEILAGRGIPRA